MLLHKDSFSGVQGGYTAEACLGVKGDCSPRAAPAHHRSPPSVSPWITQCAPSVQSWLDAHPWNGKASTECGIRVVLALAPVLDNVGLSPGWADPSRPRPRRGRLVSKGSFRPQMMGMLRVKPIATPEVKFLDRCKRDSSEGVLQVHVRRSRMRVWGAKMIRHRRSPRL
jgi:hypothetical protein